MCGLTRLSAAFILCFTAFLWAGNSLASDYQTIDDSNLHYHLLMQSLVENTPKSKQYLVVLQSGSEAEKLEYMDNIRQSIADFWQRRHISIPFQASNTYQNNQQQNIALEPLVEDYLPVINHIRRMYWLSQHHAWPVIQLESALRPNDQHPAVSQISERLSLLGDLKHYSPDNQIYSDIIVDAVKRFQTRHGLSADAVIGAKTLLWLNIQPMERARILAKSFVDKTQYKNELAQRYILVNIPAFQMVLVDNNEVVIQSKVIVGKQDRQTPQMKGDISNIVMHPTWTVPRSLLKKDVLPKVRKDGGYLNYKQFDVYDFQGQLIQKTALEWQSEASGSFPYKIVQRPNKLNSLGRYKFHFNNDQSIYLHDTPDRGLFLQSDRALSSGCIRIERVQQLADWFADNVVIDKNTWKKRQQGEAKTQWFSLSETIPVHLVYWPAWIDEQHQVQFRNDIYHLGDESWKKELISSATRNLPLGSGTVSLN